MFTIRPYRQNDHDAVYDICLKTGNSGRGAEHLYDDPMLLGHLYAGPYITIEPNTAFILDNGQKPCGYILGAKESKSFYKKMLNDSIFACIEMLKQGYIDVMLMPVKKFYDILKWKADIEEQKMKMIEEGKKRNASFRTLIEYYNESKLLISS